MTEVVPQGQGGDLKDLDLLQIAKERKLWRSIIAHILKGHLNIMFEIYSTLIRLDE